MKAKNFWENMDAATRLKTVKGLPILAYTLSWEMLTKNERKKVRAVLKELEE